MNATELRRALQGSTTSLASLARRAGIAPTTVYSFVSGDTKELKADTHARLVAAVISAGPGEGGPRGVRKEQTPLTPSDAAPVPVSVPPHLMRLASEHGLDVPALLAQGGFAAIEAAGREAWYQANREAIDANRKHIEEHGTFAQRHGVFPARR